MTVLAFSFLIFFLPSLLLALEIPARPEGYISDYAGMLSASERSALGEKLRRFEEETSHQVVVVTFPGLEGESLEDFSIRLAEAWKIGQKGKDNGVILVIFKNDRKVRIEVGYGLEGALPDATCKLIIENEIVPRFRAGRFAEGVEHAAQAIMAATRGEYYPEESNPANYMAPAMLASVFLGALLPLFLLWGLLIVGTVFVIGGVVQGSIATIFYAFLLGVMPFVFHYLFGRHSTGSTVLTRRGSYSHSGIFGGSGSGGFGGGFGGGGSFGGGGASGSW